MIVRTVQFIRSSIEDYLTYEQMIDLLCKYLKTLSRSITETSFSDLVSILNHINSIESAWTKNYTCLIFLNSFP